MTLAFLLPGLFVFFNRRVINSEKLPQLARVKLSEM